jgi:hypothetical protein
MPHACIQLSPAIAQGGLKAIITAQAFVYEAERSVRDALLPRVVPIIVRNAKSVPAESRTRRPLSRRRLGKQLAHAIQVSLENSRLKCFFLIAGCYSSLHSVCHTIASLIPTMHESIHCVILQCPSCKV